MLQRVSSILFLTIVLITLSSHNVYASQQQNNPSFFSFLETYITTYLAEQETPKQVLAAQTEAVLPSPTPTSLPIQQPVQLSEVSAYILNGVNEYRASFGLSPVQASAETCAFAALRAQEITNGFNHNGFYDRVNNHTIPYIQWAHATENIAEAPNYKEIVSLWANSPDHAANMRDNTPYVCIMQSGPYYAYEGMRP